MRPDPIRIWLDELLWFTLKEARACIFAGSFFVVLALSNHIPLGPLPRYDFILIMALLLQAGLLATRIESIDEFRTICLFHLIGFVLEVFKTQPGIGSWSYPEPAYSKLLGVPLYSGFMYAAVASYMMQAWRLFDLELEHYPPYRWTLPLGAAIYLNFFTHHYIGDLRWWLAALLVLVFARTRVHFTPRRLRLKMPLLLAFALIGLFIWVAENISTLLGAWVYPHQHDGWRVVHAGKISSWALLVVITLIIVADLKHYKAGRAQVLSASPR
jgi:uncharacterized membrane protein YoaT (DUF817 family)